MLDLIFRVRNQLFFIIGYKGSNNTLIICTFANKYACATQIFIFNQLFTGENLKQPFRLQFIT
jgi:hypothetical protein